MVTVKTNLCVKADNFLCFGWIKVHVHVNMKDKKYYYMNYQQVSPELITNIYLTVYSKQLKKEDVIKFIQCYFYH